MPETLTDIGGWSGVLGRLTAGSDLSADEARAALTEVLTGAATPAQISAFIVALRMKGETREELTGLLGAMIDAAETVPLGEDHDPIDTCGTGGDRSGTINISSVAALVAAGAGVEVCKHGNRAASSQCGSADLYEALGVAIDLDPYGVAHCIRETGIGFCFAPQFHPAMRHAGPVRRELGVPTVFNFLGPMANPARVRRQLVGVSDPAMAERMIGVLGDRGARRAAVVFGHDGLDELTTTTTSTVYELRDDEVKTYEVDPTAFGLAPAEPAALVGGDAQVNAAAAHAVLDGEAGAHRDVIALNAGAALMVAGRVDELADGVELARATIDDGAAATTLEQLVTTSQAAV